MKGISLIVVIIALCAMHATCVPLALKAKTATTPPCDAKCWEDKYHAAQKELDVFHHRQERRHLNRKLCTKWGGLSTLCNIIMSSEQSAKYPLNCQGKPCQLHVSYYSNNSTDTKRHKFYYKVVDKVEGDTHCQNLHGESGRDGFLKHCSIGDLGSFAGVVNVEGEKNATARRRRLLNEHNEGPC
eukprot:g9498.t1